MLRSTEIEGTAAQSIVCTGLRASETYFLYQKIASATSATVMIHRMMSLLRLFSFSWAIKRNTAYPKPGFKGRVDLPAELRSYGLDVALPGVTRLYPVNFTTSRT